MLAEQELAKSKSLQAAAEARKAADAKAVAEAVAAGVEPEAAAKQVQAAREEAKSEELPAGPAEVTIIQTIFDSQIRRQLEEEEARKAAGLTAFKATGNPTQDAFRRMLEKKMLETFKQEMRAKELAELENRKIVAD